MNEYWEQFEEILQSSDWYLYLIKMILLTKLFFKQSVETLFFENM